LHEGGAKPEIELAYESKTVGVKKIAAVIPVTDEVLEDIPALQSVINARLTFAVKQKEESEILNGDNSGSHLNGILPQIPAENKAIVSLESGHNAADNVFTAMTKVRSYFIEPTAIVINPVDWARIRLIKDENKNYIGGAPFSNSGPQPTTYLWDKPVVVTTAVAAGSALVGDFAQSAQLFRKGGLTLESTNSHAEFFKENKTMIRAEERLALAVYRPSAFATANVQAGS